MLRQRIFQSESITIASVYITKAGLIISLAFFYFFPVKTGKMRINFQLYIDQKEVSVRVISEERSLFDQENTECWKTGF